MKMNGVYKGTINQTTGGVSWTSTLWGFTGATQIDVAENNPNKIVIFGKRGTEYLQRTYYSINGGTTWTPLFYFTIGIRSIKIDPQQNSKVWLATSGQGVVTFDRLGTADNPEPWIVSENTTVNYHVYHDRDIIVQNGATLTIDGSAGGTIFFEMGPNRTITVEEGGRIVCENVTFGGPLGNWYGIQLSNTLACSFTNCTFNNAATPIVIDNHCNSAYSVYQKAITNCIFTLPNLNGATCVSAYEVANLNIHSNTFSLPDNESVNGIYIENTVGSPGAGPGGAPPALAIQYNSFSNGGTQISINCLSAGLTNFQINGNTFNKTNGSTTTVGMIANTIAGNFKQNIFTYNTFDKNLELLNCNLKVYGNKLKGDANVNMDMNVNSTAQLAPVITPDGSYVWYGGGNQLEMANPNFTTAGNVTFTEGCTLLGDRGRNCFTLQYTQENFHIAGTVQCTGFEPYYVRNNYWNTSVPLVSILCGGSPMTIDYSPTNYCPLEEEFDNITTGYQVTDLGNGVYDTDIITSTPGGSGYASGNEDKVLYANALTKKSARNYAGAITDLKNLLSTQDSSKLLLPALDELFINYKFSDSIRNQNTTNMLFGELKSFIEARMQQHSSKPA